MYSALPETVTVAPENQVVLNHIPHFWAVMRARCDAHNQPKQMSNMIPYMEKYTLGSPEARHLGVVKSGIKVKLPYLSNNHDLAPGDALVLPFEADMPEIFWEAFPPMPKLLFQIDSE